MAAESAHSEHPPHLAHHYDTPVQQFDSGKLGMWLFLATEILFFGGLFCAYAVYRARHPEIFIAGHEHLNKLLGGLNTCVLIASSFTMAWAVRAAQRSQRKLLITLLSLTLLGAFGFMGVKYIEYKEKWEHDYLPWKKYEPHEHAAAAAHVEPQQTPTADSAAQSEVAGREPTLVPQCPTGPGGLATQGPAEAIHVVPHDVKNVHQFFSIYFAMTGLHAVHVLAGIVMLVWLLVGAIHGRFSAAYFTPVDLGGLYWHLVDLIWIFLFPLLYLIH